MSVGVTSRNIEHDRTAASVWRSPHHRVLHPRSFTYTIIDPPVYTSPSDEALSGDAEDAAGGRAGFRYDLLHAFLSVIHRLTAGRSAEASGNPNPRTERRTESSSRFARPVAPTSRHRLE